MERVHGQIAVLRTEENVRIVKECGNKEIKNRNKNLKNRINSNSLLRKKWEELKKTGVSINNSRWEYIFKGEILEYFAELGLWN